MATDNRTRDDGAPVADLETACSALRLWLLSLSEENFDASMLQVSARAIAEALTEASNQEVVPDPSLSLLFAENLIWTAETALWQHEADDAAQPEVDDLKRVGQHALALLGDVMRRKASHG